METIKIKKHYSKREMNNMNDEPMIYNKKTKSWVSQSDVLDYIKYLHNKSPVKRNNYFKQLSLPSENVQYEMIRENYEDIRHIKTPTENVKAHCLKNQPGVVQWIDYVTKNDIMSILDSNILTKDLLSLVIDFLPIEHLFDEYIQLSLIEKFWSETICNDIKNRIGEYSECSKNLRKEINRLKLEKGAMTE